MSDGQPPAIDCGAGCDEDYFDGTVVTLTATADTGSHFVIWSGDCSGTDAECTVVVYAHRTATATFALDSTFEYLPLVLKEPPEAAE